MAVTAEKPVLLLDVDGTLISWAATVPEGMVSLGLAGPDLHKFYHPDRHDWLKPLFAACEPAYITYQANLDDEEARYTAVKKMGLPRFPLIDYFRDDYSFNKTVAITRHYPKRPVVWFDDDIGPHELEWCRQRNQAGRPTLIVKTDGRPNCGRGIEPPHIEEALTWLAQLAAPELQKGAPLVQ